MVSELLKTLREQKQMGLKGGIYHRTQIDLTYNSNHIEGNRLTHEQTRYIFETNTIGITQEAVNVNDIVETVNHFRCIDMVIDHATDELSTDFVKELHRTLKTGTSDSRKDWFAVGDYKRLPNEVGGEETCLPELVGERMEELLDDYRNSKRLFNDILDLHVRFERIHPFQDGNGRVGRILNVLYLIQEHLLNFPILYLSRYIIENKTEYYRALKGVTENQEWERWILYVLDAVEQTAKDALNKVKAIYSCRETMGKEIKDKLPGIYSKELIETLFEQPYCKIDFLVSRNIAKAQTASKYLRLLHEAGFLDLQKIGHDKYYINKVLWNILTK